jgi:L-lactate dehydrogenase complex protein LldG
MNRDAILSAVRKALGRRGDEPGRRGQVRVRLERQVDGFLPSQALLPKEECRSQFVTTLQRQGAIVEQVDRLEVLPQAIADFLVKYEIPAKIRHGNDEVLTALPWDTVSITREMGPAEAENELSLSRALAGAVETGTLFLVSGPENPSTLNFLPPTNMVVLLADDLVGSYERAWDRVRSQFLQDFPRAVMLISGPSLTADIEQTLVRGAHGPLNLIVFLVG